MKAGATQASFFEAVGRKNPSSCRRTTNGELLGATFLRRFQSARVTTELMLPCPQLDLARVRPVFVVERWGGEVTPH